MNLLIAESVAFLAVTFLVFAFIGAALAGPRKRKPRASAFEMPAALESDMRRPEPVRYLDAAAEHFTSGVVASPAPGPATQPAVKTIDLDRPAYIPFAPTQFETIGAPVRQQAAQETALQPEHQPLTTEVPRVSSLAVMTPESVEAAVQQAGSGLEPLRLSAPRGNPDDLTVISGITDDQQRQLNDYGVYHFWQIAGWSPENVAWVSSRVLSPHRIARENWMAQAAKLSGLKG